MPEITVNRDGVVGVMWYDRRDHPDNLGWMCASRPRPTAAARSGRACAGARRSGNPKSANQRRRDSFMFMGGDTAGLAADASGIFHAAWVDNRRGVPQMWTAVISVR
jgi:hypothetical protein